MFSSKMVILKGIWTFLLSLYHFIVVTIRCSSHPRPSWHSAIELAFQDLNHMGRMVRVDINQRSSSVMWRRRLQPFSTLSTPSTLAFMKPGSVPHYQSDANDITYMSWVHTAWVYHVTPHAGAFLSGYIAKNLSGFT